MPPSESLGGGLQSFFPAAFDPRKGTEGFFGKAAEARALKWGRAIGRRGRRCRNAQEVLVFRGTRGVRFLRRAGGGGRDARATTSRRRILQALCCAGGRPEAGWALCAPASPGRRDRPFGRRTEWGASPKKRRSGDWGVRAGALRAALARESRPYSENLAAPASRRALARRRLFGRLSFEDPRRPAGPAQKAANGGRLTASPPPPRADSPKNPLLLLLRRFRSPPRARPRRTGPYPEDLPAR